MRIADTVYLCSECKKNNIYLSEKETNKKCPICGIKLTKRDVIGWRFYNVENKSNVWR